MARFTAQAVAAVVLAGATNQGAHGFAGLKPSSKGFALKMVSLGNHSITCRQKLPPGGGEPGLESFFPGFLVKCGMFVFSRTSNLLKESRLWISVNDDRYRRRNINIPTTTLGD